MSESRLPPCIVRCADSAYVGFLYFKNEQVTVILNNVVQGLDLGPLKFIVGNRTEEDAEVRIIPTSKVSKVEFLDLNRGRI